MARAVTVMARRIFAAAAQFDLFRLYRERLAAVYAKVPLLWHRRQSTGTLLSSVYSDVEATFFAMAPFPFALSTIVMLVYATVVVARIDPVILLVMLALIVLLIALNVLLQRFATPIAVRSQRLRAEVAEIAHESFDGANVVKSLGREDVEEKRFSRAADDLRGTGIRFGYVRGWFDPAIDALPNLGILAVAVLGAWRIGDGHLTTGQLVEVSYLFTLMSLPIRSFGWVLGDLSRTVVGGGRVQQILDVTEQRVYGPDALPEGPGVLTFDEVSFVYRDDPAQVILGRGARAEDHLRTATALHDVSLRADPEAGTRVLAVVGATGSGKSTLALLAAGLVDPEHRQHLPRRRGPALAHGRRPHRGRRPRAPAGLHLRRRPCARTSPSARPSTSGTIRWALRVAQAETFVERPARRPRHGAGGARRIAVRRAAPAHRPGPGPRPQAPPVDPRRCHQRLRSHRGAGDPRRDPPRDDLLHAPADRLPQVHDLPRRPGRLPRPRAGGRRGTHEELRTGSEGYRSLVDAYDEAAISHNLLEASGPSPVTAPIPASPWTPRAPAPSPPPWNATARADTGARTRRPTGSASASRPTTTGAG